MESAITFCFALLIMLQMIVAVSMNICKGNDGPYCCDGYKWVQDKCIACQIGFYGQDCATKCRYPTFGRDCQYVCDCNATNCDYVKGCVQYLGDYENNSTLHLIYKTVTEEQIDPFNLSEDSTTYVNTSECNAKKTLNLLYPIIGLTAVSLIIYMMYLYTRSLENRPVETDTV